MPVSEVQSSWLHFSLSASSAHKLCLGWQCQSHGNLRLFSPWRISVQHFLYLLPNAWEKHKQMRQHSKEREPSGAFSLLDEGDHAQMCQLQQRNGRTCCSLGLLSAQVQGEPLAGGLWGSNSALKMSCLLS